MNYYLDFDYTLFDTHAFREELYEILEKNGFDKTYLALTPEMKTSGQKLLNIKEFFKSLSESRNIPLNNYDLGIIKQLTLNDFIDYEMDTNEFVQPFILNKSIIKCTHIFADKKGIL